MLYLSLKNEQIKRYISVFHIYKKGKLKRIKECGVFQPKKEINLNNHKTMSNSKWRKKSSNYPDYSQKITS